MPIGSEVISALLKDAKVPHKIEGDRCTADVESDRRECVTTFMAENGYDVESDELNKITFRQKAENKS